MVYSKRNRPQVDTYRYDVPREVRSRILVALQQRCADMSASVHFDTMLYETGQKLLLEYGGLCAPAYEAARVSDNQVIQHFFSCRDDMTLDFLEAIFHTRGNAGGQRTVEAINAILQDSAVGYELTEYEMTVVPSFLLGASGSARR